MNEPLVSIITPYTESRKRYIPLLKEIINNQTYSNLEWLTNDHETMSLGAKRNLLCSKANGEYIMHFDSDDWYSNDYIEKSVQYILNHKLDITGVNKCRFINFNTQQAFLFSNNNPIYVIGSGMLYTKSYWAMNPFRDLTRGDDSYFIAGCWNIKPHNYDNLMFARLHGDNRVNTMERKELYKEIDFKQTIQDYDFDINNG